MMGGPYRPAMICVPSGTTGPIANMALYPGISSGATGPRGPVFQTEDLHMSTELPFKGRLSCIKRGPEFGIVYLLDESSERVIMERWVCYFLESKFMFTPEGLPSVSDPATTHPVESYGVQILGKSATDAQALCLKTCRAMLSPDRVRIGSNRLPDKVPRLETLDEYQKHCDDPLWEKFLEEARRTFLVASVMVG